tara:strand:+ start:159 stop:530 length:372 start_codon:yes stop_codon:yes gene_type:complete
MINERKLSSGELKKRDEIVKAIKRDRKEENLTDEEVYAIATAQAKKTNEGIMDPYERLNLINEEIKKKLETKKLKPAITTDSFAKKYGVKATSPNLKELSSGKNAQRNPRRAAMAKALLDRMK